MKQKRESDSLEEVPRTSYSRITLSSANRRTSCDSRVGGHSQTALYKAVLFE